MVVPTDRTVSSFMGKVRHGIVGLTTLRPVTQPFGDTHSPAGRCCLSIRLIPMASSGWTKKNRHQSDRDARGARDTRKVHLSSPRSEEHTSELQSPCNLVCR